jgi:phosphoglycerate dehydrogenase-like enzyme
MRGVDQSLIALAPEGFVADGLVAPLELAGIGRAASPKLADGLIWCSNQPEGLEELLADNTQIRWIQLLHAGVERFSSLMSTGRTWTCAKTVFGPPVAEFALGLLVASSRGLLTYSRTATTHAIPSRTLNGALVAIIGGGGIGQSLAAMIEPLGATPILITRTGQDDGRWRTTGASAMEATVGAADHVVLALPLTSATIGMVDAQFLSWMAPHAWLYNVARGQIVVTDDLVTSLERGVIAGACLDVTDPEPLPPNHPLRQLENVLVTPHSANTLELAIPILINLIEDNWRRFAAGETLLGIVDLTAGY